MARGRSIPTFERLYIGGYDMSGYTIDCGERGVEFEEGTAFCVADAVKGAIVGQVNWSFGPVNGVFDNTATSGIHALANTAAGTTRYLMHSRGVKAVPTIGDDAFCFIGGQSAYKMTEQDYTNTVSMTFSHDATLGLNYYTPFGVLLHTLTSETGANSATVSSDAGAGTTKGGWLMYQIYSITGAGTITISIDDSTDGTTFGALSGATSGAIATASAPTSGIVQLATTATVKQFLRWQMAKGGSASACTFALAFMRG